MPGYVIYCRKSTEAEDRQVLSIDSQISELKQLAARLNLPVAEVLTEARSAKAPGRPVFNALMQRVAHGTVQGIICWKLDRLARNPIDGASVIWAIRQHHIAIVTPSTTFRQEDENTILMYIEFGMAQKYIDDLAKNVKRGLKTKVELGWFPGKARIGYLNDRTPEKGARTIVTDPERFPLVRRMWDLMLTGCYTPARILAIATTEWGLRTRQTKKGGGKPLARSMIYTIFTDPFYAGLFSYKGQLHQGRHEPMITLEEYDRVQVLLGQRGKPRPQRYAFAFTGLIRCGECGFCITAEHKRKVNKGDGRVHHYTYYRCTKKSRQVRCTQPCSEVRELEHQIATYLGSIRISEAFKDWALRSLRAANEQEQAAHTEVIRAQQRAYNACVQRLDNLLRLKLAPENTDGSLLSDAEFARQKSLLVAEKARLEEKLTDTGHRVEQWLDTAEQTFIFACHAQEWFAHGTLEDKRQILMAIGSNLMLKDKKLCIEAKKPFFVLEKGLQALGAEKLRLEPAHYGSTEPQKGLSITPSLALSALVDNVRTSCREYGPTEPLGKLVERLYPAISALVPASQAA